MRRALIGLLALACQAHAASQLDPALAAYIAQPVTVDPGASYLDASGAIRIGGAEHVKFIVERFNALFASTHPGVRFMLDGKGTSSAVPLLTHGQTLFGAMGRAINPIETIPYQKIVGRAPLAIAVAHTSSNPAGGFATTLAVYVNVANPLRQISIQQLSQVLSSGNPAGDFSHWGQLGLTGEWQKRAIHPVGTPAYSGFGDYLQQTVLQHRPLASTHEEAQNSEAILAGIGADPAGVGVAAIGLESTQVRQLALVNTDGTVSRGTDAEVASGSYPLARSLYFYVRQEAGKPLDPVVREYMKLVLSREGQAIIAAQPGAYIPLTAAQAQTALRQLERAD